MTAWSKTFGQKWALSYFRGTVAPCKKKDAKLDFFACEDMKAIFVWFAYQ